ncbi:hypothetical protein [Hoeflea poritis]|uniref:Secreted protein n=1 Tax=Hoeflea poritis TaxID=2993659 RepID=A0ABT4VRX0_9HYPH|nr:hypothetical protein [Hoeflea poritis]MDA4847460.1 hypothetical protein [Hoeflea poritis]
MKYRFAAGLVVGLVAASVLDLTYRQVELFFVWRPYVNISKECDSGSDRCVYVREESSTGVDYITVKSVHFRRFQAENPTFTRTTVLCDPEANFELVWLPEKLQVKSDDGGNCRRMGKFTPPFEIEIINP